MTSSTVETIRLGIHFHPSKETTKGLKETPVLPVTIENSLNLLKGFEHIADMARTGFKRELIRAERDKLFTAFVRACNKQQLVVMPDQTVKPFHICAGSVWGHTDGSIHRFMGLITYMSKRELSKAEWNFIRPQYNVITRGKRKEYTPEVVSTWGAKLKAHLLGAASRDGKNGHAKVGAFLDAAVIEGLLPKDYTRSFGFHAYNTFDYNGEKVKLKKDLKRGDINHSVYNTKLKELRVQKEAIKEEMEAGFNKLFRNIHNNSSLYHVSSNAKGSHDLSVKGKPKIEVNDLPSGTMRNMPMERVVQEPSHVEAVPMAIPLTVQERSDLQDPALIHDKVVAGIKHRRSFVGPITI
jgi:hypothetical protein